MYADRMGSITAVIDTTTGAAVAEYSYDSFGTRTQYAGSLFQFYGYAGREEDPESGLKYYRARYYDPVAGAFLSDDPMGFAAGSLNTYAYVQGNPYTYLDPSGMMTQAQQDLMLVGAGLSAVALIGANTLLSGSDLGLRLSELAVFRKSSDDDTTSSDTTDDGTGQCGPGGGNNGPSFYDRFKQAFAALMVMMTLDYKADPGMQSSRAYVKTMEALQKVEENLRKQDEKGEGGGDDDDEEDRC